MRAEKKLPDREMLPEEADGTEEISFVIKVVRETPLRFGGLAYLHRRLIVAVVNLKQASFVEN